MKIFIAVTAGPAIFQQGIADTPGRLAQSVFHGFFHHIIRIWALLFVVKACLPHTRFAGQKNNLYNGKG